MADAPTGAEFENLLSQVAQIIGAGRPNGAGQVVSGAPQGQGRRGRWDQRALDRLEGDGAPVSTEVSPGAARLSEGLGTLGAELTGVPSVMRGVDRLSKADGDPWQIAGGSGEILLGATPGLSVASKALKPAASAAVNALLPSAVGGGLLASGEAYAQDQIKADKAAGNDKAGTGFWGQVNDLLGGSSQAQKEMPYDQFLKERLGPAKSKADFLTEVRNEVDDNGRRKFGVQSAEQEANRRYAADQTSRANALTETDALYKKYQDSVRASNSRSFKERAPDVAARLPLVGLAASAGVPALLGGAKNAFSWSNASNPSRVQAATRAADNALLASPPNMVEAGLYGNKLDAAIEAAQSTGAKASKYGTPLAGILGGAGVGAEANMLPYQIDANTLPDGSPKQQEAMENAFNVGLWSKKALMNLPTAVTGYKLGGLIPEKTLDLPGAIGTRNTVAQMVAGRPPGPPPAGSPGQAIAIGQNGAAPNALPQNGQPPAAPNPRQTYQTYPDLPESLKNDALDVYMQARNLLGRAPPQQKTADALKGDFANNLVDVPVTPQRIKDTETGVLWFIKTFKREPRSDTDFDKIRRLSPVAGKTLALPGAIIGGNALLNPSGDDAQPY